MWASIAGTRRVESALRTHRWVPSSHMTVVAVYRQSPATSKPPRARRTWLPRCCPSIPRASTCHVNLDSRSRSFGLCHRRIALALLLAHAASFPFAMLHALACVPAVLFSPLAHASLMHC